MWQMFWSGLIANMSSHFFQSYSPLLSQNLCFLTYSFTLIAIKQHIHGSVLIIWYFGTLVIYYLDFVQTLKGCLPFHLLDVWRVKVNVRSYSRRRWSWSGKWMIWQLLCMKWEEKTSLCRSVGEKHNFLVLVMKVILKL